MPQKMLINTGLTILAATGFLCFCRPAGAQGAEPVSVYSFTMTTIEGSKKSLADYKGKALLIVNTASKCGYTPQYKSLQALYEKYKDRGLEILAFPANNFMNQEPGSNEEIKNFCFRTYNTSFPLFAKISVKGGDIDPLYAYLTEQTDFKGPITWNFNKFLVDPEGRVAARFATPVDPLDPQVVKEVEAVLSPKAAEPQGE